ncbi:MAG: MerR family transcriptional regulator [Pseudomonadota bacterium]
MTQNNQQDLYRIGTVASLTGISVERLRAWERRYALAPAQKSGKTRFYSKTQLHQLKLIKHLTDAGHAISSLAELSIEQLQNRLEEQNAQPILYATHAPQVALVGTNLQILEQQMLRTGHQSRIDVISRWANMEAFAEDRSGTENVQILFLQLPVLSSQALDLARNYFPKSKIIALYQFATANMVTHFEGVGISALKWPLSWPEIEHLAISEHSHAIQHDWAPRQYSDEELIALAATDASSSQCPTYLVEAINQLNALTLYSAECENDEILSVNFQHTARLISQARSELETALSAFAEEPEAKPETGSVQNINKIEKSG